MEDGGFLRTADVCSPLPFPAQYHSTPNYWDTRASEKPVVHASGAASQNQYPVFPSPDSQNMKGLHNLLQCTSMSTN